MNDATSSVDVVLRLRAKLSDTHEALRAEPHRWLADLVAQDVDRLPLPGHGQTLKRWLALSMIGGADLALAKLYEGHTDALAIVAELQPTAPRPLGTWGVWASESPSARTLYEPLGGGRVQLRGSKQWCSGAAGVTHGLVTAWSEQGEGPQLVAVAMDQPEIEIDASAWHAVGMARTASAEVRFHGAHGTAIGKPGDYLSRPGFWQGGAGIAACWFGSAIGLGAQLHAALSNAKREPDGFSLAALGRVDLALQGTAAVLRDAAHWIDGHPREDARTVALRARLSAEDTCHRVLDEASRVLGAGALCLDARFAQTAADLPVFLRQSHAARDLAALGTQLLGVDRDRWLTAGAWH